jgi:hypothetical protein
MKISKLVILILAFFCCANVNAQSPQLINYQAVVRDAGGIVVANKVVGFRLSILSGSSTGTPQYTEMHSATTNAFGLVTLNIGLGTPTVGTMSAVTWATGSKFLRVEVDINGGSTFTALGTTQFLSVPYALYAATSGSSAASGWGMTGNSTTAANFIGTTNVDDLRFNTEGSQKMVLKNNGYLGLGTNTPDFKMSIENAANSTAGIDDGRTLLQLHNKSTASFATTNLRIKTGNTQFVTMLAHYGPTYTQYPNFADYGLMLSTGPGLMMQAPAGNIRFMTGAAPSNVGINDRMIITNEGYVGIGTITPTNKLHIEGDESGIGDVDNRIMLKLKNNSTSSASNVAQIFQAGNSGTFTIMNHHSSTYTVSANADDMGQVWSSGKGLILRASPASASQDYQGSIRFYTGWNSNSTFASNERMRVAANGNVGIGTNTPTHRLRVETNSDISSSIDRLQMQLHNSSNSSESFAGLGISAGNSGTNTWIEHLSANYNVYASVYPDFNDMSYLVSSGANGMYLLSGTDGANSKIRFGVGSSNNIPVTRMTLNKTGLGIGTETPKAKIEVANGDVYVSDATKGIILKSPNGNCWRVTIDNTGNFVRTAITCPN